MLILERFLKSFIRVGTLTVVDAAGHAHLFAGALPGPTVTIRISDPIYYTRIARNPGLNVGEAYMDGALTVESGDIYDFLALAGLNLAAQPRRRLFDALGGFVRLLTQSNPLDRSRRNVAHHYDLSAALFENFLDADRQYSCAYFKSPQASLEEAQIAKKRHIAAKLLLQPGMRVLDIGCGWGGMAIELARSYDVLVHGITLSNEQLEIARQRARAAGLADRVQFTLSDYRELEGTFDRIVSVGMFEHVGVPQYDTFFRRVRDLLAPKGVALLHSIGRVDGPGVTNPWIRRYIFPGGYSPALSQVLPSVERSGLWTTDVEILRVHYAETLRHWRARFIANWPRLAGTYDERFRRMWEFYLAACEMSFRFDGLMVFQLQMSREIDTVPLTRDYMVDEERRLAAAGHPRRRESA
ncbi:MAG: class I SAM-dependent methyltransferase [Rhodospirillales bacterium]|nr:class I SAM-dependent methyltransferase [Rhodospirillales bacterium]